MNRLHTLFKYVWALMALPIILVTFIGNNFWAEKIVTGTGLKVTPWYSGGDVVRTIAHPRYRTIIHRPVFDGLVWKRSQGFVQINWQGKHDDLPRRINEAIDFDLDGSIDFRIRLNTKTNRVELLAPKTYVKGIKQTYKLNNERAVRVLLKNQP